MSLKTYLAVPPTLCAFQMAAVTVREIRGVLVGWSRRGFAKPGPGSTSAATSSPRPVRDRRRPTSAPHRHPSRHHRQTHLGRHPSRRPARRNQRSQPTRLYQVSSGETPRTQPDASASARADEVNKCATAFGSSTTESASIDIKRLVFGRPAAPVPVSLRVRRGRAFVAGFVFLTSPTTINACRESHITSVP